MAELARMPVPWLAEFDRTPEVAVDELLRGVADVAPYERAGAGDVLVMLFGGLAADDPRRQVLDDALGAWLAARRADGPEVRRRYGMNRYVEELLQALTAVYRLRLDATASRLRKDFPSYQGWLSSLALGPGQDPALELWRVMAVVQPNRRFLEQWYRLCEEAGSSLPEPYLTVGLLGLRRLPEPGNGEVEPGGRLGPEVVAGLFRWAARLPRGPASRKTFQRRLATLRVLYPRPPQRWRELALPLLDAHPGAPFRDWLAAAGIKPGRGKPRRGSLPELPPRMRREKLLQRMRNEPIAGLLPEIRALVRDYERYAEASGDAEFVVKTAMNFSGRLRRRAPGEALRLARLAHRWQPSNPDSWNHWAGALEALEETERAEVVYWEAVRRFPEAEVARNAFAKLLAHTGRSDEAEEMMRETVERFPDDPVARNALADLLAHTGRREEAEGLLREIVERFRDDAHARVSLAELLVHTGRREGAEGLLRETVERFSDNAHARVALADLLAHAGRSAEAEYLYRETIARFRRNRVAPHALAFWLLRWGRLAGAEELYRQIRDRFPEDRYSRKLAEEIARRREGEGGEFEVPDFGAGELEEDSEAEDLRSALGGDAEELPDTLPDLADPSFFTADTVAQPEAVYDAGWMAESETEPVTADDEAAATELEKRLITNAVVGRADLRLRSAQNGDARRSALADIEEMLRKDEDHVYPRLVVALHDAPRRRRLVEEVEAFHHAYPLRFLAVRETGEDEGWNRLLADFGQHRPLTLLGRLADGNGDADPADAARLAAWAAEGNGSRRGFEAFTAERLRGWLGEAPGEATNGELVRRLVAHRPEIEILLGDGLRRTADEEVTYPG